MTNIAENSQLLKDELLELIDADTRAFDKVMNAYAMTANSKDKIIIKEKEVIKSLKNATEVPLQVLKCCYKTMELILQVIKNANPNAISDAGVAGEMAHAGALGAALNIKINIKEIQDKKYCNKINKEMKIILNKIELLISKIRKNVNDKLVNV